VADSKDRARRVLSALKAIKAGGTPDLATEEEVPADAEMAPPDLGLDPDAAFQPGQAPVEIAGINAAPTESETQRKLRKVKVRRSVDDDMPTPGVPQ
jgi:hypothetical protein